MEIPIPGLWDSRAISYILPVNQQVDLQMTSQDVIHSFWVPEFRVKQDLVPGRTTDLRITPTKIGQYKVRCAELCGASHAYMEGAVNVVSQEDFDKWVTEQKSAAPVDPVLRGEQLAQQYGCAKLPFHRWVCKDWSNLERTR